MASLPWSRRCLSRWGWRLMRCRRLMRYRGLTNRGLTNRGLTNRRLTSRWRLTRCRCLGCRLTRCTSGGLGPSLS